MPKFTLAGVEYDGVIFDCDGVLLDSNRLKIDSFRAAARAFGFDELTIAGFSDWQSQNFGISRYRVFDTLLSGKFGAVPPSATLEGLLNRFGAEVSSGYLQVSEVPGMPLLLEKLSAIPLYVASGSDESELVRVFETRRLAKWFRSVRGSPTPKAKIVQEILEEGTVQYPLFIGDAHADADAAACLGIGFAFVSGFSTVRDSMSDRALKEGFAEFLDLTSVAQAVRDIYQNDL